MRHQREYRRVAAREKSLRGRNRMGKPKSGRKGGSTAFLLRYFGGSSSKTGRSTTRDTAWAMSRRTLMGGQKCSRE